MDAEAGTSVFGYILAVDLTGRTRRILTGSGLLKSNRPCQHTMSFPVVPRARAALLRLTVLTAGREAPAAR